MLTYLCLDIVKWMKEAKLNFTEKFVIGKLQTEHFLFCQKSLLFDLFSPLEVLLSGTN